MKALIVYSYKSALSIDPDSAEVHFKLGNALQEKWELPAAIASYTSALKINPQDSDVKSALGMALIKNGQHEEGLKFEKAGDGVISFDLKSGVTIHFGEQG